jgi:hypothetical protein
MALIWIIKKHLLFPEKKTQEGKFTDQLPLLTLKNQTNVITRWLELITVLLLICFVSSAKILCFLSARKYF